MDRLIKRFDAVRDQDLMICARHGVAYQRDMKVTARYDQSYFDKCAGYEDQAIALKINAGRIALVDRHAGAKTSVLDVGIGSGEFIKKRRGTFGFDINPVAQRWLKERGLWRDNLAAFKAFTFWDVIEHVEDIETYFKHIAPGGLLFTSLPVFEDLRQIRGSRHYRPGEHLYYWTEQGFLEWMALHRFELLERSHFETHAGRESIGSFAFRRSLPDYHATIGQYQKLHAPFYGGSAGLYFDLIAPLVLKLDPASILDYGCGRSDLVAWFWKDGARRLARYDPAVAQYMEMPAGRFDLAICCDVLEHILMADVDRVLTEIRSKSEKAIFTISLKPARARLPDGRNAHVTLLTADEWLRWIRSYFGQAEQLATSWDHILLVKAY